MRVLLDLRPPKLIKRPASQVSWVRVLLGLLGGGVLFLALVNLGYGTFRVVQFHREAARLEQERQQLEAQAGKLGSEAERLKKRQADLEGQLAFLQEDLPSLELLSALDVLTPQGVSLAGLAALYAVGMPYMALILNAYMGKGMTFSALLWAGMLPYLPGDAVKIIVAAGVCPVLRRRLRLADGSDKRGE